jgi:non-ribosomal peptide synthase protein (TIGR01720 family)
VLGQLFADAKLDFLLLSSSLITSWPAPGWIDYAAANAYLDAFARRFTADTGTYAVAVGWPRWREAGMAVRLAAAGEAIEGISNADGLEVFRRVLDSCDEPQIAVSDVDFRDRMARGAPAPREREVLHQRPDLQSQFAAPRDDLERQLAEVWEKVLGIDAVGIHDNYFELGGDSVQAIHIAGAAREIGVALTARDVIRHPTVAGLAAACGSAAHVDAEQGVVTGPVALTPIQHWFFEQDPVDPDHFNLSMVLELRARADVAALRAALCALSEHHDALRLRCRRVDGAWRAEIAAPADVPLDVIGPDDDEADDEADGAARIEQSGARLQAGLDLADGPAFRAALFRGAGGTRDRLLLIVHHLAMDVVSWRILLEDLDRCLGGRPLPPKATSVAAWAEHLVRRASSADVRAAADRWLDRPWDDAASLPLAGEPGANTVGSVAQLVTTLSVDQTAALLRDTTTRLDAKVDEVLLAALSRAFGRWADAKRVIVDLEGHGRDSDDETVDVSRTVGWFTALYPVLLETGRELADGDLVARTCEALAWFRDRHQSYGVARYLARDERLSALPRAAISFVYLGTIDQLVGGEARFDAVALPAGPARSPRALRYHALEIEAVVSGGQLRIGWSYSENQRDRASIDELSRAFESELLQLIAAETPPAARRFGWSDDELRDMLDEVEGLRD